MKKMIVIGLAVILVLSGVGITTKADTYKYTGIKTLVDRDITGDGIADKIVVKARMLDGSSEEWDLIKIFVNGSSAYQEYLDAGYRCTVKVLTISGRKFLYIKNIETGSDYHILDDDGKKYFSAWSKVKAVKTK